MKNLILLHGALGAASQWEPFLPELKRTFDVHVLEFEGHGATPSIGKKIAIDNLAKQLDGYIAEHHLAPANIFGYSMGGYVALYLARRRPAAIGRIMTLATKFDWTPESAAREVKQLNPDMILTKIPAFAAALEKRHPATGWRQVLERTAEMMSELGNTPALRDADLVAIRQPVCIAVGEWDTMVSAGESEHAAGTLPNGELRVFMEMPHPLEKVDVNIVCAALRKFMDQHP